jgi:hypothetical protein
MFAPKIAKAQTKAAESSSNRGTESVQPLGCPEMAPPMAVREMRIFNGIGNSLQRPERGTFTDSTKIHLGSRCDHFLHVFSTYPDTAAGKPSAQAEGQGSWGWHAQPNAHPAEAGRPRGADCYRRRHRGSCLPRLNQTCPNRTSEENGLDSRDPARLATLGQRQDRRGR